MSKVRSISTLSTVEAGATVDQTKADIEGLGIAASSITGALPAIDGSALTKLPVGSVVQVVSQPLTTYLDWSDASAQTIWTLAITTAANSKIKVDFTVPTFTHSCTGDWCNMAFVRLLKEGNSVMHMEHEGVDASTGSLSRNITGTYVSGVLAAGTHTFSLQLDPYKLVRWRVCRAGYEGSVSLTEIVT